MKILHIITGLNDGGAEAVLFRLCTHDKSNDHVVISMMGEGKYGSLFKKNGVKVHCLNMPQGRLTFRGLCFLFKLIRAHMPDVVQTWMYHADLIGGLIARLAGVKNVVWGVHHTNLVLGQSKRSTIIIARVNALLSRFLPKKIIFCAEKSRISQESIGFDSSKGVVVPNGYDISDFKPSNKARMKFRKEIGVDDTFLIGHVGRFSPYKDYSSLLEAFNKLSICRKGVRFVLVGSGLEHKNSELLGLFPSAFDRNRCFLLGCRNDIQNVMNGIDLFVLSSVSEAFPNVLNEAMACGTPCVTTDVGDAALIVSSTGWVVPPKDPEALANAIMQAIDENKNNHQDWLKRKKDCRDRIVNNFSIQKMAALYHKVWFDK